MSQHHNPDLASEANIAIERDNEDKDIVERLIQDVKQLGLSNNASQRYWVHNPNEMLRLEIQALAAGVDQGVAALPISRDSTVLDAGCGSGAWTRAIARQAPHGYTVGVDLNSDYMHFAQRLAEKRQLRNVTFCTADLRAIPFRDDTFDLVHSRYVFQFLPDPDMVVAELRRVTRPGGRVVIADVDWEGDMVYPPDATIERWLQTVMRARAGRSDNQCGRKLGWLLDQAGFTEVSVRMEPDPVYSCNGAMPDLQRLNFQQYFALVSSLARESPAMFGSPEDVDRIAAHYLAWFAEGNYRYTPLFWATGRVPQGFGGVKSIAGKATARDR